jgi:hypothetical protein
MEVIKATFKLELAYDHLEARHEAVMAVWKMEA